ncbi:protein FAM177A1-like isoform X1 [Penaeus japonicus]|uniref:protein FAM177A1-like isoform X1 n=1 Tax=Penaeus japonicus TaxID=27405 RepID=UPI001C70C536|nr:protein FAM177A1-like isoform X1 [Penaeus japonicus]
MMTGEELQMFDLSSKPPVQESGSSSKEMELKTILGRENSLSDSCSTKYGAANYTRKDAAQAEAGKSRKLKKPRRVLHFSDGTLEEYSTEDEEEEESKPDSLAVSDPKALTWGPWIYYWMLYSGSSMLSACDYVGESLANFLGITSPKYQYEIDEYNRAMEEEAKLKEEEEAEMAGWTTTGELSTNTASGETVSTDPTALQSQSPTCTQGQPDIRLPYKRSSDIAEVSSSPSSSSSSYNSPSSSSTSSPSFAANEVKYWMSKVHTKEVTEMSTWV